MSNKIKAIRTLFHIVSVMILIIALLQVFWITPAQSDEKKSSGRQTAGAIAKKLEEKRISLDDRERQLEEREKRLDEREKELSDKIEEMKALRTAISGGLAEEKKKKEEQVEKMVKVFETMSPKAASSVIETLDDWLAVEILKRMDTKRMAKLMNVMDKHRSARLSELVTGYSQGEEVLAQNKKASRQVSSPKGQQNRSGSAAKPTSGAKSGENNAKKGGSL